MPVCLLETPSIVPWLPRGIPRVLEGRLSRRGYLRYHPDHSLTICTDSQSLLKAIKCRPTTLDWVRQPSCGYGPLCVPLSRPHSPAESLRQSLQPLNRLTVSPLRRGAADNRTLAKEIPQARFEEIKHFWKSFAAHHWLYHRPNNNKQQNQLNLPSNNCLSSGLRFRLIHTCRTKPSPLSQTVSISPLWKFVKWEPFSFYHL